MRNTRDDSPERVDAAWQALINACKGCVYHRGKFCEYMTIVGHCKPSKVDGKCVVRADETPRAPRARVNWDKARTMYDSGVGDRSIAQALGCSLNTVRMWRSRNKLPRVSKNRVTIPLKDKKEGG